MASTTEKDFFQIKENLKNYMRGQSEFADYDFDGSAMSTLLDVLSHNTHYNAITAKMSVNEMFLDTSQLRSNIVSHAKILGYTPKSVTSAMTSVTITGNVTGMTNITIPRGTKFNSNDSTFKFVTLKDYNINVDNGVINAELEVHEGKLLSNSFTVTNSEQIFQIPNKSCDTDTLRVTVTESTGSTNITTYTFASSLIDTLNTETLYYVQEGYDEHFDIYFGDDIIGKKLDINNVINIEYLKSSGLDGNNISKFTLGSSITGLSNPVISTANKTSGGANIESLESIKINAPYLYTAQNRTVTPNDYKSILTQNFSDIIDDISIWGGETANPPIYGKVFLSVKPKNGRENLTGFEKLSIIKNLDNFKLSSILPEFVDPTYIYVTLMVDYIFNPLLTKLTETELSSLIFSSINDYNDNTLSKFNNVYYNSDITTLAKNVDPSILSITTKNVAKKHVDIILSIINNYSISFNSGIYHPHTLHQTRELTGIVTTNSFKIVGSDSIYFLEDDGDGNIQMYYKSNTGEKLKASGYNGTVDYTTGDIKFTTLNISEIIDSDYLEVSAQLDSFDIVPIRNDIISIEKIDINGIQHIDKPGNYLTDINYKTVPSRL